MPAHALLLACLVTGAIILLPSCGGKADPSPPLAAQPLTPEEKSLLERHVERLLAAAARGEALELWDATDYAAVRQAVFSGTKVPDQTGGSFINHLKEVEGGFLSALLNRHGKLIRLRERQGCPAATVRLMSEAGGLDYVDLVFHKSADGRFKVIDLFSYVTGLARTQQHRHLISLMFTRDQRLFASLLDLPDTLDQGMMENLNAMVDEMNNGSYTEAILRYQAMPEELRKKPFLYSRYLTSLNNLRGTPHMEDLYVEALKDAPTILGPASSDLLLVNYHTHKKNHAVARRCIENALQTIGPDAYLYFLLATNSLDQSDVKAAKEALSHAEDIEPDLPQLIDLRESIASASR